MWHLYDIHTYNFVGVVWGAWLFSYHVLMVVMEAVRQLVLSASTASSSRIREVLRDLLAAVEEKRERDMMDVAPVSYGYGVLQVYQERQWEWLYTHWVAAWCCIMMVAVEHWWRVYWLPCANTMVSVCVCSGSEQQYSVCTCWSDHLIMWWPVVV